MNHWNGNRCRTDLEGYSNIPDGGLGQGGASEATARQNIWQTSGRGSLLEDFCSQILLPWSYSLSFLLGGSERGGLKVVVGKRVWARSKSLGFTGTSGPRWCTAGSG